MKNKTKVEELDATLVLMQKKSAIDGVGVIWKRLSKLITKVKDLELSTFLGERGGWCGRITFATSWKENAGKTGFTEIASETSE